MFGLKLLSVDATDQQDDVVMGDCTISKFNQAQLKIQQIWQSANSNKGIVAVAFRF